MRVNCVMEAIELWQSFFSFSWDKFSFLNIPGEVFFLSPSNKALEIFQILFTFIILPSAPGSILLSKHLTFCHPRLAFYSLRQTSSFVLLRSHLLEKKAKKKRISCRKFMNKFKDAVYGEEEGRDCNPELLLLMLRKKLAKFMNFKW